MKIQSSIIRDTIELTDANGDILKSIPFTVNCTQVWKKANIIRAEISKIESNDIDHFGELAEQLFRVIFGDAVTDELIQFYDGDFVCIVTDCAVILNDLVYPAFNRIAEQNLNARKAMKNR